MKIQMIVRDVGKYSAREAQSGYPLLHDGMGADFHKTVVTTGFDHLPKQPI